MLPEAYAMNAQAKSLCYHEDYPTNAQAESL